MVTGQASPALLLRECLISADPPQADRISTGTAGSQAQTRNPPDGPVSTRTQFVGPCSHSLQAQVTILFAMINQIVCLTFLQPLQAAYLNASRIIVVKRGGGLSNGHCKAYVLGIMKTT